MGSGDHIRHGGPEDLPRLESLWVSVHHAHVSSMPELAPYRGRGLGSELLDRLEHELHAQGVTDLMLGVLPGNVGAVRLYERRGYRPTWMYMSRFGDG